MRNCFRLKLIPAFCAVLALCAPAMAQTRAKPQACPEAPLAASYQIWPEALIPHNGQRTGLHPCGKTLECFGGSRQRAVARTCTWLP